MTPDQILGFYSQGFFPMAEHREDQDFQFYAPYTRALLPIRSLHIPKRLKRKIHKSPFDIRFDTNFAEVIRACANMQRSKESGTWINDRIISLFIDLHELGIAHSVESWKDGRLVGGLYGLALGSTFCGESMFSIESDASKIALVYLCEHLHKQGFKLLDSQFRNPHLDQFGLYEIPQKDYVKLMQAGLGDSVQFYSHSE